MGTQMIGTQPLVLLALVVGLTAFAYGDSKSEELVHRVAGEKVQWAGIGVTGAWPGLSTEIHVEARIEKGWHIYSLEESFAGPTRITVEKSPLPTGGPVREPEPHRKVDKDLEHTFLEHRGTVRFTVPIDIPKKIASGTHVVPVRVAYQACDPNVCLPAPPVVLKIPVVVTAPPREAERKREVLGTRLRVRSWGREVSAGGIIDVELVADMDFGWHIYSLYDVSGLAVPTRITLAESKEKPSPFRIAGKIHESRPKAKKGTFGETVLELHGIVTFRVPIEVPAGMKPGAHELAIQFESGACDVNGCDPPERLVIRLPIEVRAAKEPPSKD